MQVLKFLFVSIMILGLFSIWLAEDNGWTLIPQASWDVSSKIERIWSEGWKVWDKYNEEAWNIDNVWDAFASGIFSWNIIFDYFKYLANLLSEIWLVIGAAMIIYAGYKYTVGVFTQDASKGWKDAVKWAIYWLLIIIFSYVIMRLLLAMFW